LEEVLVKKAIISVFFLTLVSSSLAANQTGIIQTDEVALLFEERLRGAARDTVALYPKLKAQLEKTLIWEVDFKPTVLLTADRARFEELTGNSLVVAYAVPTRNLIVIDFTKASTRPFSIGAILKHELCHLLLHKNITRAHLPRWLDEGVSQWSSDGIAEIIRSNKRSYLNGATLSKTLIELEELSTSFPADEKSLLLAYEQSKSLVDYISKEFGRDGILNLLHHLKQGYEIDEAIQKSLSVGFEELERRWRSQLRKNITWFTYLAENLYGILFFFAALITIVGFVRVVIKRRRYEEEEPSRSEER
jgi:hypothetical protein